MKNRFQFPVTCGESPPCKDCTDREIGCHSSCEKYKGFLVKLEKARKNYRHENQKNKFVPVEYWRSVCR